MPFTISEMTSIALIAGTYQPESCGVAHYTARLRDALDEQGIKSVVVLTTHAAAYDANDASIRGTTQSRLYLLVILTPKQLGCWSC